MKAAQPVGHCDAMNDSADGKLPVIFSPVRLVQQGASRKSRMNPQYILSDTHSIMTALSSVRQTCSPFRPGNIPCSRTSYPKGNSKLAYCDQKPSVSVQDTFRF